MTRRERLERKLEKRQEWAEGRDRKARAIDAQTPESLRRDLAFITQPGRIPERERMNRRDEKAHEHRQMAAHHRGKAAGLESQLERTIFSDDDDAIERLREKVARLEEERERYKALNRIIRRKPKNQPTPQKIAELAEIAGSEAVARKLFEPDFGGRVGIPSYVLTNLGGNIKRCKDRIAQIEARQERQERAEAAGGVLIEGNEYVRVTFPEKPEREVLNALKAAGFRWGGGYWYGPRSKLPPCVEPKA